MTQIKSVKATHTVEYSPDLYLKVCEYNNRQPTQEGFIDYLQSLIEEDFSGAVGPAKITVMDY